MQHPIIRLITILTKSFKYFLILNNIMRIIRKVWKNKGTKQLLITMPKDSHLKEGDYVEIKKIE